MALTNIELEASYNSLARRLTQIERAIANLISTTQLNGITLLLEKDINDLKSEVSTLKQRVQILEDTVNDIH